MALTKAFPIGNGKPIMTAQGFSGRAWQCNLLFATLGLSAIQVQVSLADIGLDNVQGVFIDNSNGNSPLTLQFPGANQKCVCPPYSQGIFPVLFLGGPNLSCTATSASNVDTSVQFTNVGGEDLPPLIWSTSSPAGAGIQTVQGIVQVSPTPGAFVDRGASIVNGGTSILLMPANGSRKRMLIKNPASAVSQNIGAAESLFLNFGSAASIAVGQMSSIELQPGEGYDSATGPVSSQAIYVNAATTGHIIFAKEM